MPWTVLSSGGHIDQAGVGFPVIEPGTIALIRAWRAAGYRTLCAGIGSANLEQST